jgi:hypothetical protein
MERLVVTMEVFTNNGEKVIFTIHKEDNTEKPFSVYVGRPIGNNSTQQISLVDNALNDFDDALISINTYMFDEEIDI